MANLLRFHAVVSGRSLASPDLGAFEGKRVEVIVLEEEEPANAPPLAHLPKRQLGFLRGQLIVPDDFDEALPADIQKYFDGDSEEP